MPSGCPQRSRTCLSMLGVNDPPLFIKDIKAGLKNLNVVFIVLEIGKWGPQPAPRPRAFGLLPPPPPPAPPRAPSRPRPDSAPTPGLKPVLYRVLGR